jgi:hypothetical protein
MNMQLLLIAAVSLTSLAATHGQSSSDQIQVPLSSGSSLTINLKGDLVGLNIGASGTIHYDVGGRIDKVGNTAIGRDVGGRIARIGDTVVKYGVGGQVLTIGDAALHYDAGGRLGAIDDAVVDRDVGGRVKSISTPVPLGLRIVIAIDES